jgi:chemotaxis protein methyltransferase CheR
MFRDPEVYAAIRTRVAPILRTYPFLRVWHAGCSSGEEVYSLAIVLAEEGLYDRALLYATDISDSLIQRAKRGVFPIESMRKNTRNYHQAGGRADFSDYWVADQHHAVMRDSLRKNLVFSRHSLVTDGSFNEFHVIFCRNVIIYFDQELRRRVHQLLYDSLGKFGLIVLGLKETMDFTPQASAYEAVDGNMRIYRRIK